MSEAEDVNGASLSLHGRRHHEIPAFKPDAASPPFPGLKFLLPTPYPRPASVDFSDFSRAVFAEQAARIIWSDHYGGVAYKNFGVVRECILGMHRFDQYLEAKDAGNRIQSMGDVSADDIDRFEDWLYETLREGSSGPWNALGGMIRIMRAAVRHRFASGDLSDRLAYISLRHGRPDSKPRDAYSPYVMGQIREGARTAVEEVLKRMRAGEDAIGPEPLGLTSVDGMLHHLRHVDFIDDQHSHWNSKLAEWGGPPLDTIMDLVYPRMIDLVPFAILIADDCGLPPESIQELGVDCVEMADAEFGLGILSYKKRRREGTEELFVEPVKTREPWSTGWLVDTLRRLTAKTREQMGPGADAGRLFIGRAATALKPLHFDQRTIKSYLKRHPVHAVEGDGGALLTELFLARIRKTVKAKRYEMAGGDLSKIGDDHSVKTFASHYAPIPALQGTHDASIEASLHAGLAEALRSTILSVDEEKRLRDDPAGFAREIGRDERQIRRVGNDATQVWMAGCLDFGDSPFAGETRACGAPFWGCFDCRNAVITPSKLPSLLRLLEHLRQERQTMGRAAFERSFGLVVVRLRQIIARFPRHVVERSMEEAKDEFLRDWSLMQLAHKL